MGGVIRRPLRQVLRPVLFALALIWTPFVVLAAVDLDIAWVFPSALAFLPYAAAATVAVLVLALALRSWAAAAVAAAGLAVLLVPRTDRVTSDAQPRAAGPPLTVATSNVMFGEGDAAELVRIVRRDGIDVLAVQEDTPDFTDDLAAAGLGRMLPYGALHPEPGARGVSLYSRYPVSEIPPTRYDFRSRGGLVTVPGTDPVHIRSVHPPPPFRGELLGPWKRRMGALPSADPTTTTILAGDYNATLDHHPFRALLARGYRDAADQTGDAWRPTWSNGRWATLTIDHVLVSSRVAVDDVAIHHLPGSDHDVVVSRLRLPK